MKHRQVMRKTYEGISKGLYIWTISMVSAKAHLGFVGSFEREGIADIWCSVVWKGLTKRERGERANEKLRRIQPVELEWEWNKPTESKWLVENVACISDVVQDDCSGVATDALQCSSSGWEKEKDKEEEEEE